MLEYIRRFIYPRLQEIPIGSFVVRDKYERNGDKKKDGLGGAGTPVCWYRLIAFPTRARVLFIAISS